MANIQPINPTILVLGWFSHGNLKHSFKVVKKFDRTNSLDADSIAAISNMHKFISAKRRTTLLLSTFLLGLSYSVGTFTKFFIIKRLPMKDMVRFHNPIASSVLPIVIISLIGSIIFFIAMWRQTKCVKEFRLSGNENSTGMTDSISKKIKGWSGTLTSSIFCFGLFGSWFFFNLMESGFSFPEMFAGELGSTAINSLLSIAVVATLTAIVVSSVFIEINQRKTAEYDVIYNKDSGGKCLYDVYVEQLNSAKSSK